ncbi:hypothetical protein CVS40_10277 [Lucilia cuprina]|nr:hypothetical protein CVS40_10277 [Lucilia cuprina]
MGGFLWKNSPNTALDNRFGSLFANGKTPSAIVFKPPTCGSIVLVEIIPLQDRVFGQIPLCRDANWQYDGSSHLPGKVWQNSDTTLVTP